MPSIQSRGQQVRTEELFEYPITGPFGGVQSELPTTEIESFGFFDSRNIMFRKGTATVRPGYTALTAFPAPASQAVLGFLDFYNSSASRIQAVLTPTRLLKWNSSTSDWTDITGPGLTGSATDLFGWDVLGQKICFSQGVDKIRIWDGIAGTYSEASVNAPAARYLAEIGLHLLTLDTIEGGTRRPQRYRWSGAGDPTDWTSFSAGVNDNLNNLGPGAGLIKLGQYGYGFHVRGIIQVIPTGIGALPYYFTTIINVDLGNIEPRSLSHFNRDGIEQAIFLSEDNVYIFNQASLIPIGDQPIDGRRRYGARTRILADALASSPGKIYGYVTKAIAGNIFNAYWLVIPGIRTWVFNFDENNWTPFDYDKTFITVGSFYKAGVPRIIDLVGTIQQQGWTPANLTVTTPFGGAAFGSDNGVVGYVDFTNYSETAWQILSGYHTFSDRRHKHSMKKFRLVINDLGSATYDVIVSNESGFSETRSVTLGNGSGDIKSIILAFNISGLRIQWKIIGNAGVPASFVEFCPIFDVSGEQRGGQADSN